MSATSPPFRVLKFGGTSITGLERVEAIAGQVRERVADHAPVVVVSAFAGVTDALIAVARTAASGQSYEEMEAPYLRAAPRSGARAPRPGRRDRVWSGWAY